MFFEGLEEGHKARAVGPGRGRDSGSDVNRKRVGEGGGIVEGKRREALDQHESVGVDLGKKEGDPLERDLVLEDLAGDPFNG